jgi:putative Mn2+ efflux pump MntP
MERVKMIALFEIFLISIGLALDAFAVSIAGGISQGSENRISNALKMALSFGFFQAFMPVIGWYAGINLIELISEFDHWVAFSLLVAVGLKMIYESSDGKMIGTTLLTIFLLSIATSIDALAVGLSFGVLGVEILLPALLIGSITFLMSFSGFIAGDELSEILGKKVEVAGGIVLIVIGVRILLEHL